MGFQSSIAVATACLLVCQFCPTTVAQTTQATSTAEPSPDTTEFAPTAPAPLSTSSSFDKTTIYKPPGTCCKVKNPDGSCADIQQSDPELWTMQTPFGSNDWCEIDYCACGFVECVGEAKDCGYNSQSDAKSCLCHADCFEHDECCDDYADICNAVAPAPKTTAPSPSTPSVPIPPTSPDDGSGSTTRNGQQPTGGTTTAPSVVVTTTTTLGADPSLSGTTVNASGTLETADNTMVIIIVVVVVVVVAVVVVVVFVLRAKNNQNNSKPLFSISTGGADSPASGGDVELSTRAKSYETSRSGRRSKTPKRNSPKPRTYLGAADAEEDPKNSEDNNTSPSSEKSPSSRSSSKSRRSRRSKKSKSKSPSSASHDHDDVFASPTHHNFEL